jgi:hypothetical protein
MSSESFEKYWEFCEQEFNKKKKTRKDILADYMQILAFFYNYA